MRMDRYIKIAVALIILPMLAACRKEVCYDHYPTMDVSFTWEREWERDYGKYHLDSWDEGYFGDTYDGFRPDVPEWVNMVRYFEDARPQEHFLSPDGGRLMLSSGKTTSMLLYNGDTEYIILSDMASQYEARASATQRSRSSISYVAERHPGARTTNPPDKLFSAYIEHAPQVANHELKPLPVKMQPLVYTYVITYEFEYGLQHVALARGALGGMAESVYLRDGRTSEETAIILFDCDIADGYCRTQVRSFGIPGFPDEYYGRAENDPGGRTYTLNLEVMLKNGKLHEFNFDITDQMTRQPRGGVIKIDGLRIEDEENLNESGFNVDVDDWGDHQDIDLPVGV